MADNCVLSLLKEEKRAKWRYKCRRKASAKSETVRQIKQINKCASDKYDEGVIFT